MKKIGLLFLLLSVSLVELSAEVAKVDYQVIPMPKEVIVDSSKVFVLSDGMGLAFDASDEESSCKNEPWFSFKERGL